MGLCVSQRNQTHARLSLSVHGNSVGTATKTPNEDYRVDLIEAFVIGIQKQLRDKYASTRHEFDLFCIIPSSINHLILSYLSRYQVYAIRTGTIYSINKHALLPLFHEIRFCHKLLPNAAFLSCGSNNRLIVRTLYNEIYSINSDKYHDSGSLTNALQAEHQKQRAYLTQLNPFQSMELLKPTQSTDTDFKHYADSLRRQIEFISNGYHSADEHRTYYKLKNGDIFCCDTLSSICKLQPILFDSKRENIMQIELGQQHTLFLSHSGRVYALGKNHRGQLGISARRTSVSTPVLVDSFSSSRRIKIRSISCGKHHSLCVDENDNVYTFGCNQYRQCRAAKLQARSKSRVCSYFDRPMRLNVDDSMSANLLSEYDRHSAAGVVKAKCGSKSTVILYQDGHLLVLGTLSVLHSKIKQQLEVEHIAMRDFDVGMNHIVLVSVRGEMYSFGLYDKTNVYRLQRDMFPNLAQHSTVHSVIAAASNTIVVFN
mmetsp:Transcript_252/g.355  ORF Transcript_252/g.355 Transcript_252/m.355 type:complete len:485 (-) Transcript_252:121-1575(-)